MTKDQKLEFVRQSLRRYESLAKKHLDEIGYVAFVLSCSRAEAARIVNEAREPKQEG